MDLTTARLQSALRMRPCQYYPTIDSTNERALSLVRDGAPQGSVIVADEQTQGRGRLGRAWFAPPGTALMFSYVMHPRAEALTYIGMMAALSVCETVEALGAKGVGIKWPNDVQIDGLKLCGVLPEAAWQGERLLGVALGIGLNVRVDFAGTPFEGLATSLQDSVGKVDRANLLARLLERLDYWTPRLESDALYEGWRARLVMLGRPVRVTNGGGTTRGVAEDVERQGALLIRDEGGVLRRVIAGDMYLG
jgi:BirA family biotin operon repressor/biotin-[acetyl-CoA-carboxylase] ligase